MMRKYREKYGKNRIFYLDGECLLLNKVRIESAIGVFIPLQIKFRSDSISHVEIGHGYWRRHGYMIYVRIFRKNGRKSIRYWFNPAIHDSDRKFREPVRNLALVNDAVRETSEELEKFHIPYAINEKEVVKTFL